MGRKPDDNVTPLRPSSCPVCRKRAQVKHHPFCSRRCRDVDLSRWLKGSYRVPTGESPAQGQPGDGDSETGD